MTVVVVLALAAVVLCYSSSHVVIYGYIDHAYVAFDVICGFSVFVLGVFNHVDCQNLILVLGGTAIYLALRHIRFSAVVHLWMAIIVATLLLYSFMQHLVGERIWAIFSNENYFAGFLAVAAPIILSAALDCGNKRIHRAIAYAIVAVLASLCIALIHGRSALMGVGAVLVVMLMPILIVYWQKVCVRLAQTKALRWMLVVAMLAGACIMAVPVARQIYMLKPISSAGRVLIWSVAARMAAQMPMAGVGFGNFKNTYNLLQAEFFAHGGGSVPQRMAGDSCWHSFNEPLEVAAELGLPGLLVFVVFCALILKEVWEVVRRNGEAVVGAAVAAGSYRGTEAPPTLKPDYLTLGMAGSVVCFMVMSLFHFPRKVVPTWLVFNYALAWVVTANANFNAKTQGRKENQLVKMQLCGWRNFWAIAFLSSVAVLPLYVKNYLNARRWIAANELMVTGELARAYAAYNELYPKLKWSGRFCAYYGDAIMAASEDTNENAHIYSGAARQAVALYEKAKYTYPDPYMFENLAVAYLRLADGTNWPVVAQTQYRIETPAQALARKWREWRCGTNLFFEPPATELTRGNCIGRAIDYLTLASNILPWRLTSRWYLAQIYRDVGDVSNAVKYAQLVVNIPMKKDTPQGREFKRNAQKMLNELGVKCDDPGLVVFDIHDRKTWNEGAW